MESKRSFRDDALTSVVASFTGSLAGVAVAVPVGWLTFVLVENDCSGEYCGLSAAIAAGLFGLVLGLLAYAVAATRSLFTQCPAGERLRPGLLTFLGIPIFLAVLFAIAGLG